MYQSIDELLTVYEADSAISDVHLADGYPISYRKVGLIETEEEVLTRDDMVRFLGKMLENHPGGMDRFEESREIDFNYYSASETPYRVNAYHKLNHIAVAMRKIAYKPMPLSDLMYDDVSKTVIEHVLNQKTGLFLVTGPTGSGKTTSLIAMLEYINQHRREHMVTIEDPIEYIFEQKECLISQREFGSDTLSFEKAMKAAMRQDPDIIFVGEIRDRETAEAAMNLAETGHLVFSTLHTRSASNTVYRMISLFPSDVQESIKDRLAASLLGIQSQFLLQQSGGKKRIGLYELMINTVATRNDIRKNEGKMIDSIIETSRMSGMISHKEYAKRLISEGHITKESVDWLFE